MEQLSDQTIASNTDLNELNSTNAHNNTKQYIKTNVYNTRYTVLFLYSLNTLMNGELFTSLSPVNNLVTKYYSMSSMWIDWLSNVFLLIYVFLSIPCAYFIDKYGLKRNLIAGSFLNLLCTIFHYIGYKRDRFYFVFIGQIFASMAFVPIIQMPGYLSANWFPETSRATATSIAFFMNILGVAIGFIHPNIMIKSRSYNQFERDLKLFYFSQFGSCLCIFVATAIYFQEKPPLPPSQTSLTGLFDVNFLKSLKTLSQDANFLLITQTYGIYFANYVSYIVLANSLITETFPTGYEKNIGYMGLMSNLIGICGCFICGFLIDRYKMYKLLAIVLNMGSLLMFILFSLSVSHFQNFSLIFSAYIILGVFGVPYFSLGVEQAAEMTYPVNASTSSAIILLFGCTYGTINIIVLGVLIQYGKRNLVLIIICILYSVSFVLSLVAKTKLKRTEAENEMKSDC